MTRTIGMVYDPHITAGDRRKHDGVATVTQALEKLNEVGVDWTVIGGDVRSLATPAVIDESSPVDWGGWDGQEENAYYRNDFQKAKALFEKVLDSPYYVIRGNNDRPLPIYQSVFSQKDHPRWGHFIDDGARYVFLDSNPDIGYHMLNERQNFVSAPQLSMLDRMMDEEPEIPTFVFCHAMLAKQPGYGPNWDTGLKGAYYVTTNYPSVQFRLERGNTIIVNSGHYYGGEDRGAVNVDGIEYVNARHLVHGGDPEYAGDVRWMEVDTESNKATVRYYNLEDDSEGTLVSTTW